MLFGYMLGDTLDGPIARPPRPRTTSAASSTPPPTPGPGDSPGVIVYAVYARGGHATGFVLMAVVITCATVRQALFSVAKMGDPLMYTGLPRTVSGFGAMAYALSSFFFGMNPARYVVGVFSSRWRC